MGQSQGDFSEFAAEFLNLVGGESGFSTHPLAAQLVEINCGAIVRGFILEDRQWLKGRPQTDQDALYLGLLLRRDQSSDVGFTETHDFAAEALAATTMPVAANLC